MEAQRRFVTCTACREQRKSCSLRRKTDAPPCDSCFRHGVDCTFENSPSKRKPRAQAVNEGGNSTRSSPPEPQLTGAIPEGAKVIHTALAHPILFLHLESKECDWCVNGIGVLGFGWTDALVVPSANGLTYTELSGGHNSPGTNSRNSKMCANCTMSRCRIVGCAEHEMRPLDGLATKIEPDADAPNILRLTLQDYDYDIQGMYKRLEDNKTLSSDKWCALCPLPALYQCCTTQDTDMWGDKVESYSDDAEGCGLVLCEDCKVCLEEFEGNLEEVMDAIEGDAETKEIWVSGLRADAEFLRRNGLLVRNVMEDGDDEEGEGEAMDIDG